MKRTPKDRPDSIKFILNLYDAFLRESCWDKIAAALDMNEKALRTRIKASPDLQFTKALAEERRGNRGTLRSYIYQRLSAEAKKIWDELQFWEGSSATNEQIESILDGKTKELRQELFIHALVTSNFDTSSAMKMVGISRDCLMKWRRDLAFRQLIEEIQWHKKNFFETALMDLIEQRHPGAVIFANKTVNKDRGYAESLEVKHSGKVEVGFSLNQLNLSLDVRKVLLAAIQEAKALQLENAVPHPSDPLVIDVLASKKYDDTDPTGEEG